MTLRFCLFVLGLTLAQPVLAAPGLGGEIYPATVEAHELEIEARYGALNGGPAAGEDNSRVEISYGISEHLQLGVVTEFEKDPGGTRHATHLGFEAIAPLGRIGGIDIAAYGEYEIGLNGKADSVETKLLVQHRAGLWDLRFNLVGEKPLQAGAPVALSYAASVDRGVTRNVRLGVAAFGDLGTVSHFVPYAEHYLGPVAKFRIPLGDRDGDGDGDQGVWLEAGYLFPLAAARAETKGQFRFNLEFEL